jgi:hypothetical protein
LPLSSLIEAQARNMPRGSTVVLVTPSTTDDVYRTCDLLVRRGHRPVGVLLDAATFGGYLSPDRVIGSLQMMNIPYTEIKEGDDLSASLTTSVNKPVF